MCAINVAAPNYSVCTCTVIGNRYILWSYYSTSWKMIRYMIFQVNISIHLQSIESWRGFCFVSHSFSKGKATRELRILRFDLTSLTWIINKTLHQLMPPMSSCWWMPAANVPGPGTRVLCSSAECKCPLLSLFAAHGSQLSVCAPLSCCQLWWSSWHHHDHLLVTADAAHQDDSPGHLGQDDGLLSQR